MATQVLTGEVVESVPATSRATNGSGQAWALIRGTKLHPVEMYLELLAPRSQKTQRSALKLALAAIQGKELRQLHHNERADLEDAIYEFPWNELGQLQLNALTRALIELGYASHTQQRTRAAVKRVMRMCTDRCFEGTRWHMTRGDYDEATDRDGAVTIKSTANSAPGRALDDGEMVALFNACTVRDDIGNSGAPEHEAVIARDQAILGLLFHWGMRVSEVCKLKVTDYHRRSGKLDIKNAKTGDRVIHISGPARQDLDRWLDYRFVADRRRQDGPIFYRIDHHGKIRPGLRQYASECPECGFDFVSRQRDNFRLTGRSKTLKTCEHCGAVRPWERENRALSVGAVRKMLLKRCDLAGIDRCTTHDGRRTTISWFLENDSLQAARELAGHKEAAQTLHYQRYSRKQHAEAIDAVVRRQARVRGREVEA